VFFSTAAISDFHTKTKYTVSQKSEPPKNFATATALPQTCTDLNEILHTQDYTVS